MLLSRQTIEHASFDVACYEIHRLLDDPLVVFIEIGALRRTDNDPLS